MKVLDSTEAKTNFGALLDAAQRTPVSIRKKGRPVAVMLSQEDFEDYRQMKLDQLHREIQIGIDAADRGELVDGKKAIAEILAVNAKRKR